MNDAAIVPGGLTLLLLLVSPVAAKRPNVVFILTDNHGAWTLGCYGNKDIRTPNIDRLAEEGMRFTRAMSSNPVCSPTRATYLAGLDAFFNQYANPEYNLWKGGRSKAHRLVAAKGLADDSSPP